MELAELRAIEDFDGFCANGPPAGVDGSITSFCLISCCPFISFSSIVAGNKTSGMIEVLFPLLEGSLVWSLLLLSLKILEFRSRVSAVSSSLLSFLGGVLTKSSPSAATSPLSGNNAERRTAPVALQVKAKRKKITAGNDKFIGGRAVFLRLNFLRWPASLVPPEKISVTGAVTVDTSSDRRRSASIDRGSSLASKFSE